MYLSTDSTVPGVRFGIKVLPVVSIDDRHSVGVGTPSIGYFTDSGIELLRSQPLCSLFKVVKLSNNRTNPNRFARVGKTLDGANTLSVNRLYPSDVSNRLLWSSGIFHDIESVDSTNSCTIDGQTGEYDLSTVMVYNPYDTLKDPVASGELTRNSVGGIRDTAVTYHYTLWYTLNHALTGKVGFYPSKESTEPVAIAHIAQTKQVPDAYLHGYNALQVTIQITHNTDNNFKPMAYWDNFTQGVNDDPFMDQVHPSNRGWFNNPDARIVYVYSNQGVSFEQHPSTMIPDGNGSDIETRVVRPIDIVEHSSIFEDHIMLPSVCLHKDLKLQAFGIINQSTGLCMWRQIVSPAMEVYKKSFYGTHFKMSYLSSFNLEEYY